jgi:chaperone required for assembly of F1-ATPase
MSRDPDDKHATGGPKGPIRDVLRPALSKRFYKEATRTPSSAGKGHEIHLDGRPLRTPMKRLLVIEGQPFSELVLAEWLAQAEVIDPASMPATRLANSAVDTVADNRDAALSEIVAYAGNDLLCYRATSPAGLVARQNEVWNPIVTAVGKAIGARFVLAEGVMHTPQPEAVGEAVASVAGKLDNLQLAALLLMTTITGSAILALAYLNGSLTADEVWSAAHLDEDWQIAQWGRDEEAEARRAVHERDFRAAAAALAPLR